MPDGLYIHGHIVFEQGTDRRQRLVILENLRRTFLKGLTINQALTDLDTWKFEGLQWEDRGATFKPAEVRTYLNRVLELRAVREFNIEYYDVLASGHIVSPGAFPNLR